MPVPSVSALLDWDLDSADEHWEQVEALIVYLGPEGAAQEAVGLCGSADALLQAAGLDILGELAQVQEWPATPRRLPNAPTHQDDVQPLQHRLQQRAGVVDQEQLARPSGRGVHVSRYSLSAAPARTHHECMGTADDRLAHHLSWSEGESYDDHRQRLGRHLDTANSAETTQSAVGWCHSDDPVVQATGLDVLGELSQRQPELLDVLLEQAERLGTSESYDVRWSAVHWVGEHWDRAWRRCCCGSSTMRMLGFGGKQSCLCRTRETAS